MVAEVKMVALYNGHSVKSSGAVDLNLKADYSELGRYVQLLQMLNNDIKVAVKLNGEKKPLKLGMFRLKQLSVQHDGEGKISLNSTTDFVEVDLLNRLVTDERFIVRCTADIEIEEEPEEEE